MRNLHRVLPLLPLLFFAAGCVESNAVRINGSQPVTCSPIPWQSVKIYLSRDKVGAPFEEVALLNASGDALDTDEADMVKSFQKKAAKLCANGVLLEGFTDPSAGAKVAGTIFGVGAERKGKAIAIHISDSPSPPVSPTK